MVMRAILCANYLTKCVKRNRCGFFVSCLRNNEQCANYRFIAHKFDVTEVIQFVRKWTSKWMVLTWVVNWWQVIFGWQAQRSLKNSENEKKINGFSFSFRSKMVGDIVLTCDVTGGRYWFDKCETSALARATNARIAKNF